MDAIAKLQEAVQKAALDTVNDADEEVADIEPAAAGVEIDAPEDDARASLTSCPPHTAITRGTCVEQAAEMAVEPTHGPPHINAMVCTCPWMKHHGKRFLCRRRLFCQSKAPASCRSCC